MDGGNNKFSSFVTPTGGGLFAYNAPESQYQQIAAQAAQGQGQAPQQGQQPPAQQQTGQAAPPPATPQAASSSPTGTTPSPQSPTPQPTQVQPAPAQPQPQQSAQPQQPPPASAAPQPSQVQQQQPPPPQQQQQVNQPSPSAAPQSSPPQLGAAQQAQAGAAVTQPPGSPQQQHNAAAPSAYQQQMLQAKSAQASVQIQQQTSLFETLLNDTYVSTPASMGFDTTLATTLGMNNNLGDLRLEALNQNAQAAYLTQQAQAQASQVTPQQQQQASGSGYLPSFQGTAAAPQQFGMPPQAQPALPLLAQQNALLAQQNAALLASNPLLAAHNPYLAQHAIVPNVWNKWGGWNKWAAGYGHHYPPPYKTPGAPIKMTDCDKGPEGCNLFVFHIPNDMTNLDLYQMFSAFGTVISARIMVDKVTGRSRGFGFVSYNNPESAELAIKNMNGFVVGHKRLKVEQKKDKHQLMPPTGTAPFSAAYLAPLQRWAHYHQQAQAHVQAQAIHAAQAQAQAPPAGAPSAHAHAHHFYTPTAATTTTTTGLFNQS